MDSCKISRWQQLKAQLNNLEPEIFVETYLKKPGAVCIDVRTKEEYQSGHLPGALHLDYLSPRLADLLEALEQGKTYFIYCRTGRRSLRVCTLMQNMGFKQVYNCDNGIKDLDLSKIKIEAGSLQSPK